ncbi:hypothetical protein [Deinococcus knuensis]|uniref:AAA+ ATPase domain-containing protein n=1 Tax=Deinococcus knuensis TaxID=1837380 RepID=A0ABQ2SDK7_9DEIO|nr:hypothetical protein [Deinococcus knuensis]GGS15604.1 hypothetical protein GCM10008961_03800 [Deinococcus knuensis]
MPPIPTLDRLHLERIVTLARPGEIHVIVAPPGSGKSTLLREVIAKRTPTLERVAWATPTITQDDSLGAEAQEHFNSLKVTATRPRARNSTPTLSDAAFAAQFTWGGAAEVKVISHIRVRHAFGPTAHPAQVLQQAQLLVIDEDPAAPLLLSSHHAQQPIRLDKLSHHLPALSRELMIIADIAEQHALFHRFQTLTGTATGAGVQGDVFWKASGRAGAELTEANIVRALSALGVADATVVAQTFMHDLGAYHHDPARPSERFGIDWPKSLSSEEATLRYNILPPLTFRQPVLILDAYASQGHYEALFPGQSVTLHHFDPGRLLDVQCAPQLRLHELREHTNVQVQGRKQIAEEISELARTRAPQQQLLLTPKRLREPHSSWHRYLTDALAVQKLALGSEVHLGHWLSGRGNNTHSGRDVLALTPPLLNRRHIQYTLTGLYPYDPSTREQAAAHLLSAEALQMLHRGRQHLHSAPRPLVVLALGEADARQLLEPHKDAVNFSPYPPLKHFKRYSKNPRWFDALQALARELRTHFPHGLPSSLLRGLPIHTGKDMFTPATRLLLEDLSRSQAVTTHLHQAFHNPGTWVYRDVKPSGSSHGNEMEREAMLALGFEKFNVTGHGRSGKGRVVYAHNLTSAESAWADYYSRLPVTSATMKLP